MRNALKFLRVRKIFFVFVCLFMIIFTLRKITEWNPIDILDGMSGGSSIYHIYIQMAFFVFVYLIQYFNADLLLYMTNNRNYLSVRYKNHSYMFNKFVRRALCINLLFLLLVLIAVGFNMLLTELTVHIRGYEIIVLIVRTYRKCYLFALLTFVFLTCMDEEKTFGAISGIVLVTIFLKQLFDFSYFETGEFFGLIVTIAGELIILFGCTRILEKIWKGIVKYAD